MRKLFEVLCSQMAEEVKKSENPTNEIQKLMVQLFQQIQTADETEKIEIVNRVYNSISYENVYMTIFLYSFMLEIRHDPQMLAELITYVIENKNLTYANKNFLFYQFSSMIFLNQEYETKEVLILKWKLLETVKAEIEAEIKTSLVRIPYSHLNQNVAVVITEQFLSENHGPSKTALDRCAVLKNIGKKVLFLNTCELLTETGQIPLCTLRKGMFNSQLSDVEILEWKGIDIPFFQCENKMPDPKIYEVLLQTIYKLKPATVINIGGSSVFAGMVNEMIPVLTIGTTQSGLATTLTDYQMAHGKLDEKWLYVLEKMGKSRNHLIEGRFTFSLKEQTEHTSRGQEGIPEDQFLLAVVGGRLDAEVKEDFFFMLEKVLSEEIGIVFIGKFDSFQEHARHHSKISRYMYYFGMCDDVLSKLEICDLYVNPTRKGGATSAVEAMSKGKPPISVNYGDVAGTIGDEFCCSSYEEMAEDIKRYQQDENFYRKQSEEALELAEKYLDSDTEFVRIVKEYQRRMQEQ